MKRWREGEREGEMKRWVGEERKIMERGREGCREMWRGEARGKGR